MLKDWLRRWLEIEKDSDFLRVSDTLIRQRADRMEQELNDLKEQVRTLMLARVKENATVRATPRYSDYESAQVTALNEFKES